MKHLYESIFDTTATPEDFRVRPKSKEELMRIIAEHIKQIKPKPGEEVDFNWIDISHIDDLSGVFSLTNYIPVIDKWDITHVKDFKHMFTCSVSITRSPIPVLQEKLLAKRCYERMFANCIALKEPPELPAMELEDGCYCSMFANCKALEEPPELPAMELTDSCYSGMFEDCTSLQVAPDLPAMELKPWCYCSMFQGCTSLQVAPELLAMELGSMCYKGMFENCKSLIEAPVLPAKKLKMDCYMEMFKNCSNLKAKAKIPTGANLDAFAAQDMYKDCPCENK